jgi:MoxR-like ATPase
MTVIRQESFWQSIMLDRSNKDMADWLSEQPRLERLRHNVYRVIWTDASVVVAIADTLRLGPTHPRSRAGAGLIRALAEWQRYQPLDAPGQELGDALAWWEETATVAAAQALCQCAEDVSRHWSAVELDCADLEAPPRPSNELPRTRWRRRLLIQQTRMAQAGAVAGCDAPQALLYRLDGEQIYGPTSAELAQRRQAAERLGGEHLIPECLIAFDDEGRSTGDYECGPQEHTFFALIRNRLAVGQRAFAFRGPPGSGKDTFAQQIAAIRLAPCVAFNIGPTYSFEDAIGTDGLRARTVVTEDRLVRQPDREVVLADGSIKVIAGGETLVPGLRTVVPVSARIEGPLTRAVREDCVVVIQEPEGMENEAVRLHSIAGDRVGDPGHRYLTVNSSEGEIQVPVHPECIVIFTYNSGEEDVRFKTALHDRMGNLDFEYPDLETEARRFANMVTKMMNHQTEAPELRRTYTADEVLPMVRVLERARAAHAHYPQDFVETPGSRQGVHCFCDLLLQGYSGDEAPVDTMAVMLQYLLPGSEIMPVEQRQLKIREVLLADEVDALNEIAQQAALVMEEN